MRGRRLLAGLLVTAALAGACGETGPATPAPSTAPAPSPTTPAEAVGTDRPFGREAWPADASACDLEGYAGRLGRVEALAADTVRFTLCAPDAAFPARLAHPALGIVDSTALDAIAPGPEVARGVSGAGAFRVEAWTRDNVRLVAAEGRADDASTASPGPAGDASPTASSAPALSASPAASAVQPSPATPPGVVVLRWAASSATRTAALRDAEVDGIDAPSAADAAEIETLPELALLPRPGLATAYLGFGGGRAFAAVEVRRAFAQGIDREALVRTAFPPGSEPASYTAPCSVPGGCEGLAPYEFNGPQGAADLALAGFDTEAAIALHHADAPVAGLPDPPGAAAALRDQLAASLGVTVELVSHPAAELRTAIETRAVTGLYLWGMESSLADASGFLEPLVGAAAGGNAANRAKDARDALATAAATVDPGARVLALGAANDAVRNTVAIVPLAHPGTTAAYRADVVGAAVSPLGTDPLGVAVPADRRQLVVMGADEPAATWCAVAGDPASLRLCALVTPGLFVFPPAGLTPQPWLVRRCTPSDEARTWTCRLRDGLVTTDGKRLDAGDVLATFRAVGDAGGALRSALPAERFATWDALLGGPVPSHP